MCRTCDREKEKNGRFSFLEKKKEIACIRAFKEEEFRAQQNDTKANIASSSATAAASARTTPGVSEDELRRKGGRAREMRGIGS